MTERPQTADLYRRDPDWSWLASPAGVVLDGGALTFVHRMDPDEVFRKFGLDPSSAQMMTAEEALGDPVLRTAGFLSGPQWIRVAVSGEWTVVIEYVQMKTHIDSISSLMARDTEVVYIAANENDPAEVRYLSHGQLVFAFTCGGGYDSRAGTQRHMFDNELTDSGLIDFSSDATIADNCVAMMAILGRRLGFTLTPETVTGPLPTAHRMHRYTPSLRDPGSD